MAVACANCGQVGGMQAGLDKSQCLYCGGFTNADGTPGTATVEVHSVVPAPMFAEPDAQDPDRRRHPGDPEPAAEVVETAADPEPDPEPVTPEPAPVALPAPIDLAALTPEQVDAIEAIANMETK
jgi:hypothetical protein